MSFGWTCKYIDIATITSIYEISLGISYYLDWKVLQIKIPFVVISLNFSGDWAGGYNNKKELKQDD